MRTVNALWGNVKTIPFPEPPEDSKPYGRQDKDWIEVADKNHDHEIGNQVLIFENNLI